MNNTKGKAILTTLVLTAVAGSAMAATGAGSTVFGAQNEVTGTFSLATGTYNKVDGTDSLVSGTTNKVDAGYSMVTGITNRATRNAQASLTIGTSNQANAQNVLVTGYGNYANADNSFVGGSNSQTRGYNSIAFGSNAQTNFDDTYAIGKRAVTSGINTLSIGNNTAADARMGTAVGYGSKAKNDYTTAVGYQNTVTGNQASAFGADNEASGANATAVGNKAVASGNESFAVGFKTNATAYSATSIGNQSNATGISSLAIGTDSTASNKDTIAIGHSAKATHELNIAIGSNANAVGNNNNIAIGNQNRASGPSSIVMGFDATSEADNTLALGNSTHAVGYNSTAIGTISNSNGVSSVSIGHNVSADGTGSVNIGHYNIGANKYSTLIGDTNIVDHHDHLEDPEGDVLIGSSNVLQDGYHGTLIGANNNVTNANYAVAIGNNNTVSVDESVAIGHNSVADNVTSTASGTVAGTTTDFAGGTAIGTVSVGDSGKERTVTNVAAGRISSTSTDAVNGSQLNAVVTAVNANADAITNLNNNVVVQGGENIHIDTVNGNQRGVSLARNLQHMESAQFGNDDDTDGAYITKESIVVANNVSNTNISAGAVRTFSGSENTGMTAKGIVIENTDTLEQASFTSGGMQASDDNATIRFTTTDVNVGNQQVHGVKAGVADTDAVNVKQLKDSITAATSNLVDHDTITTVTAGANTTVTNDGNHNYTVSVNKDLNDLNSTNYGKVTDSKHAAVTKDGLIAFDGDVDTKHNANGMIIENRNTLDVASYNINGMTASDANSNVRFTTTDINAGDQQIHGVKAGTAGTDVVNVNQMNKAIADNATVVQAGDNVKVHKDYNTYTVSIGKDLTGLNSVGLNDGNNESSYTTEGVNITYRGAGNGAEYHTSYKYDGVRIRTNDGDANPINEVSLTDKGLNNGGNRITNVSKGIDGTDAVNVNQLNNAIRNINGTNNQLANTVRANQQEARKGIAGTAALAGLHPLDFDPDHKLDIMAGYGHFHNANAGAIGVAYRPNEDLMFTAGTTFGSDNVINAGVTYKVGARSEVSRSKVAMAKDLAEAKKEIAQLQADNAKFKAILNAVLGLDLPQEANTVFPDIEENHWAYVAVDDMAKRGLLVGYPDGTFKGDRAVTRYEFAEVIHRAIEKAKELGESVDQRLIDEFKPELMRYAVEGKKHERVHVNKSNKEVKRDQYGTAITK